jgi:hypothetical protein
MFESSTFHEEIYQGNTDHLGHANYKTKNNLVPSIYDVILNKG